MTRITERELTNNGLNILDNLTEFTFSCDAYGNYDTKLIENKNFVKRGSRFVGRDMEVLEIDYRKKSQQELNNENLDYRIKQLESEFKIKITYAKL